MTIREFEEFIRTKITEIVLGIIKQNEILNISAKSRSGAEVSSWLEEKFVETAQNHPNLSDSESAPKGKTKNPWDVRTFFNFNGLHEEIWIDFKAFKLSSNDSNPDIGTPNKIIKFIEKGGFYLLYIYVYYQEHKNGLKFIQFNSAYTKSYFLKDISSTFRRTPTNQLQVNISAEPTYRTRQEFIELFMKKIREGLERQLRKAQLSLTELDAKTEMLKKKNSESEEVIVEKIQ